MKNIQGYIGIDRFRIIAALLVVAVHTSPLLSLGEIPDYFFARVLARTAVPFFLATTGFFMIGFAKKETIDAGSRVFRSVGKMALIYIVSIILYLPVNIYSGQFNGINTLGTALKMLLVDGTTYHLWYLPASIFGTMLVWVLLRYTGIKAATAIAGILYVIGLFGDSYYGLITTSSYQDSIYQWIFNWCDYTRNGLFYAPVFILTGVWAARRPEISRVKSGMCFSISLILMAIEGMFLYNANIQRHDSMYIMLPICTFFLMTWLSTFKGKFNKTFRNISLIVYIIHIWIIVLLRGLAKLFEIETWILDNSILHYILVCACSFAAAYILLALKKLIFSKNKNLYSPKRAWIEIDLKALKHNAHIIQNLSNGRCKLMPAIKANAYGLGVVPIAKALYKIGVKDYCVASLSEGIELRQKGVRGNILILGYTHPDDCYLVKRHHLKQTIVDYDHGVQLANSNTKLDVHIKVDIGMRRLGEPDHHVEKLVELFSFKNLNICGIFTQLPCSDSSKIEDVSRTKKQIETFYSLLNKLKSEGVVLPEIHIQCSYGIINYPEIQADFCRPGLALYGIVNKENCIGDPPEITPIFTVKSRIALVKNVSSGEYVGYGNTFVAPKNMRIAIITMGYADGLPRNLSSGKGSVIVGGQYAPIVGNICMDQTIVDVSDIPDVSSGNESIIIGKQNDHAQISITDFAERAGTIPNEIVSRLGERLERIYLS